MSEVTETKQIRGPKPKPLSYGGVLKKHKEAVVPKTVVQPVVQPANEPKQEIRQDESQLQAQDNAPKVFHNSNFSTGQQQLNFEPKNRQAPATHQQQGQLDRPQSSSNSLHSSGESCFNLSAKPYYPKEQKAYVSDTVVKAPIKAETLSEHGKMLCEIHDINRVSGTRAKYFSSDAITVSLSSNRLIQWKRSDAGFPQDVQPPLNPGESELLNNVHQAFNQLFKPLNAEPINKTIEQPKHQQSKILSGHGRAQNNQVGNQDLRRQQFTNQKPHQHNGQGYGVQRVNQVPVQQQYGQQSIYSQQGVPMQYAPTYSTGYAPIQAGMNAYYNQSYMQQAHQMPGYGQQQGFIGGQPQGFVGGQQYFSGHSMNGKENIQK